ncbi:MAG: nicotinamide-nucleotide amidohydrolase family protein [Bacteroidales bacterium]|nr:nicotinamide-nucleotide amidohydrolase family protein [Bacteroidales bacterium]
MTKAAVCTIGDEILIGQIVDTNSSAIASALEAAGVRVTRMVSISDKRDDIIGSLRKLLSENDIVITTGGLGPTKDDITKDALAELSGSTRYIENAEQKEIVCEILHSRGLDILDNNLAQAMVPETARVILNRLGTAPIMVFRIGESVLYSLPGVPHEALGALPEVIEDIKAGFPLSHILHRTVMTFGMAESALSKLLEPWEDALPEDMHLAYLPSMLTGVRLRLSLYGSGAEGESERLENELTKLKGLLGDMMYSEQDDTLENALGKLLLRLGKTVSAAESCTGGEIAHLFTSVSGSSAYFLGSVTSYAVSVKEKVLGVPSEVIEKHGVVSAEVAEAMAIGVRKLLGSDFSVATTGLSGPSGDGINPVGTVWIAVDGPLGPRSRRFNYHNDRKRNIERFSSAALNFLRLYIISAL